MLLHNVLHWCRNTTIAVHTAIAFSPVVPCLPDRHTHTSMKVRKVRTRKVNPVVSDEVPKIRSRNISYQACALSVLPTHTNPPP